MKQIFKNVWTYELNGMTTTETGNCWHYAEIPSEEKRIHTFDELPNRYGFLARYTLFKGRYDGIRLFYSETFIDRSSFKSASTTITPIAVDVNEVSITTLAEKLSAMDFVAWCHDNGVTAIAIK